MRMSKTHKIVVAAVAATLGTAGTLTFTRAEPVSADQLAAVPRPADDVPLVAGSTPDEKPVAKRPKPSPSPTTAPTTTAPSATAGTAPTTGPRTSTPRTSAPAPSPAPAPDPDPEPAPQPSPSPTKPKPRNLLEILLGS